MKTGLQRTTTDKFYTKPDIVALCCDAIKSHLQISRDTDTIIEPSAGNGAFVDFVKSAVRNYHLYDLVPEHCEIVQQDYLEYIHARPSSSPGKIHVIGNPPFGRQSSLAIRFIKKSCQFCDSLSFILPKSFKKNSLKRHFPPNFHLQFETDLPDNSFVVDGVEHNVPCVFQIWKKTADMRAPIVKLEPRNYTFVDKTANHDISFRRVGVNAGAISTETADKSVQSHYFIKFATNDIQSITNAISQIQFDANNTVGPKSISKQELILKFNSVLPMEI
jgi:hypothetical protein